MNVSLCLADAEKARARLPHASETEHKGKEIGNKATAYIDEIVLTHQYSCPLIYFGDRANHIRNRSTQHTPKPKTPTPASEKAPKKV